MSERKLSRRGFLGVGASGLALATFGFPKVAPAQTKPGRKLAKNVIFCVSDGMSIGVPTLTSQYLELTKGKPSYWRSLGDRGDVFWGLVDTRSLNSEITDSSAASSSWSTGRRIWNGQVSMFPDGTELKTLCAVAKDAGMKRGLVTTATITHATPAGFGVSHHARDDEQGIAVKYLQNEIEVLMGGGNRVLAPDKRKDGRDLYEEFRKKGYEIARTSSELAAGRGERVLAVFSEGYVPFEIDRVHQPDLAATVPSLAEMSRRALRALEGSSEGFLLQIEGARIDHGAHANDFAASLFDQIAFEEAVRVAMEFAENDGETLVVVTSDHGNSNPGLAQFGEYGQSERGLPSFERLTSSFEGMSKELGACKSAQDYADLFEAKLGVRLTGKEAVFLTDPSALQMFSAYRGGSQRLALVLGNHTGVGWVGSNHSSDWVILSAFGPGAERFAGPLDNTDCFDYVLAAHGLRYENPRMTFEEAQKFGRSDAVHVMPDLLA